MGVFRRISGAGVVGDAEAARDGRGRGGPRRERGGVRFTQVWVVEGARAVKGTGSSAMSAALGVRPSGDARGSG